MSETVIFRDDVSVELIKASASDADVIWAARVSTAGEQSMDEIGEDPARSAGLINYLARERHGSPFEHTSMTFFVSAPIFVFREFMRHRIASYNEESGRYRELKPVFYIPSKERKLVQVGKTGAYTFEDGTAEQFDISIKAMKDAYLSCLRFISEDARSWRCPRSRARSASCCYLFINVRNHECACTYELPITSHRS